MNPDYSLLESIEIWLNGQGMTGTGGHYLAIAVLAAGVILLSVIVNFIAKKILLAFVKFYVKRSSTTWDDALLKREVFQRLSHLAPAIVIYASAAMFPVAEEAIRKLAEIYMLLVAIMVFDAFLNSVLDIYNTYDISLKRPIKGYIQVIKIVTYIFAAIYLLATLINRSPFLLLSGLGAMTAVLMLIFKDLILGLVAGVQLTFNDLVRIGDWIEMPKYGADGDVIDISLNTVRVQNWDKTITSIPAYSLISDSFKNWRGMTEAGGRRIKRSINIDMTTIHFCDEDLLNRYRKIQYLAEYIEKKAEEIARYNEEKKIDTSSRVNGRKLTNVGTFRAYVAAYLRNHPAINQNLTFLIRQLKPTEHGLPIEIYVFTSDTAWANYEGIQADIFDHILAVIPEFDLRVYQAPAGSDIREALKTLDEVRAGR